MSRVAILGCGPAGLLAAHACSQAGVEFAIFSKRRKSQLYGSQYLHNHIPGITGVNDSVDVKYVVRGTPEEYRRKTHGKFWDGHVAPEDFEPDHKAWNIRQAYDVLWQKYGHLVNDYTVPKGEDGYILEFGVFTNGLERIHTSTAVNYDIGLDNYDLVVSTLPRVLWMVEGEEFIYSEGWALGDAPEEGKFIDIFCDDNTIICDGTPEKAWTRVSRVFGYGSVEWPGYLPEQPHPDAARVLKPLHYKPSASNSNPTRDWLHVGRYGQFEKGVVVTDAYDQVVKKLKEL